MLKRIYIDNYRCLSNFEFAPGNINLLLGASGTGKSTLFDALLGLRDFAVGRVDLVAAFPRRTRTRWDSRLKQTLSIEVETGAGPCAYRLEIEHVKDLELGRLEPSRRARVAREELSSLDGKPLFQFLDGEAHLFRDDHSPGPVFPADWTRSLLATVPARHDNTRLTAFKEWLERFWILAPDPRRMSGVAASEARAPSADLSNLASWYRSVLLEEPGRVSRLFEDLREVLAGFREIKLVPSGDEARRLNVRVSASSDAAGRDYDLDELSDGQRALLALYGLLRLGLERGATLLLDEPDNYVPLPELQPWLMALRDSAEEAARQVLLISHHPEVINYFVAGNGRLFEREVEGPVRVREWAPPADSGLDAAEIIARGWE